MTNAVSPIPEGYNRVIPYLAVNHAEEVLSFLKQGLGAEEIKISRKPSGELGNAELRIGDSVVMLTQGRKDFLTPASLYCYLADVDAAYSRALAAGGTSMQEPADMFYGDRVASIQDAGGNQWWLAARIEEVPPAELTARMAAQRG